MPEDKSKEEMEYESMLRRRLEILQQQFKAGKVKFAEGLNVEESLLAVRKGPDGEIDLNTVDGLVRSLALAVTAVHDREELKKESSLKEIQEIYFRFIEVNFGHFYKIMVQKELTPRDAGRALTQSKESIDKINGSMDEFLELIKRFWEGMGEIAQIHVEDMHGNIKGVFGGDLFPAHTENIASKCGIYTDTIILPDPFLRSSYIFENYSPQDKAYFFIKHAMNILQYKELACADVEVPIIAILPDQSVLEQSEKEFYHTLGQQDSLVHTAKLFGRKFESFEELMDFAQSLDTIERTIAEIGDTKRVLFDTEWNGDIASQLKQALESEHYKPLGIKSPGALLAVQSLGRMTVSNELLIKSRRLNGTPIIDAPTSWQYLAWKIEYDADRAEIESATSDLHIIRGLQDLSLNEMQWIGNIPVDALIDIRKQGAMDEIRNILGQGINDLVDLNPSNFHGTRDQIFNNITSAFSVHKHNIDELKSKQWKFAGKDIGSWLVVGSIGVAAAATGMPVWGLAAVAADQLLDAPKLKDIPKSIRDLAKESNKVKKSPVAMLFNIHKKNA